MAVSPSKIHNHLKSDLEKIIDSIEHTLSTSWAVYSEYCPNTTGRKITKIMLWSERDWDEEHVKIANAIDEMDAYKKFMEKYK